MIVRSLVRSRTLVGGIGALCAVLGGCAGKVAPAPPPPAPMVLPVAPYSGATAMPQLEVRPDPIGDLIAKVEREFTDGQAELDRGRLVAARGHFDAAVDLLTTTPGGARSEARLSRAFDQLLDRISALDVLALREGDGFTETRSEPAAIDELLNAGMFERPKPALTTQETVMADLEHTPHDVDIPVNEKVLGYIELFQGRLREFMTAGLQRATRYLPMIQTVFQAEGLPLDLAYVPLVESAFKNTALSRVSAKGMWQFMLPTAQEHGLKQTWFIDERSDPEKATRAAAQYLKTLRDMFDGDWNFALASYNAGPGRLQRAVRQSKTADYWKLTTSTKYLPRETREYVPMIMAAIVIAKNPSLYGFDIGAADTIAFEHVTVPNALDLKIIAEWGNVSVDVLRDLNPELRRTTTPAGQHDLKVPLGTAATIQSRLLTAEPLFVKFQWHTVARGETVGSIARRFKVRETDLRAANDLSRTTRVKANQTLRIPERATSALPSSTATRAVTASAAPARVAPTAPARSASSGAGLTYRVQRGDTLFSIAQRFDTTIEVIKRLNNLRNNRINIGDKLTVRGK